MKAYDFSFILKVRKRIIQIIFKELENINKRSKPFEFYKASDLWTDEYTSKQTLSFHLDEGIDVSSRSEAFIERSVEWIASHFNIGVGKKLQILVAAQVFMLRGWQKRKLMLRG